MKKILLLLLYIIFISCVKREKTVITGDIVGIPASKVFLVQAKNFRIKVDSAIYDGKRFTFRLKDKTEPFLASIIYFDDKGNRSTLVFLNDKLSTDKSKVGTSAFMTDHGEISIKGAWRPTAPLGDEELLVLKAGSQNAYYQKNMSKNLAYIDDADPTRRTTSFEKVKLEISKNSSSFYLLEQIFKNRDSYAKDEIRNLLSLFEEPVQKSDLASALKDYLLYRPDIEEDTPPLHLKNIDNIFVQDINQKQKVNMLVFWASWCVPCRHEIPYLKDIRTKISSPDFYMASISIDSDQKKWIDALNQENMTWECKSSA